MWRTQTEVSLRDFMTAPVQTLPVGSSLADAYRLMRTLGVRHVPILGGDGAVAGVVSDRDLSVAKRERGIDPDDVMVEEVMAQPVYSVEPDAPLVDVAEHLARNRFGCAVVQHRGRAVGIFTTTDALRALAMILGSSAQEEARER